MKSEKPQAQAHWGIVMIQGDGSPGHHKLAQLPAQDARSHGTFGQPEPDGSRQPAVFGVYTLRARPTLRQINAERRPRAPHTGHGETLVTAPRRPACRRAPHAGAERIRGVAPRASTASRALAARRAAGVPASYHRGARSASGGFRGGRPPGQHSPLGYTATSSSWMKPRVLLGSTGMPGPIVVVIVAFLRYRPLAAAGLSRMISSSAAA
jgi:hypothetical protein